MSKLDTLSEDQRMIYDELVKGRTVEQIAEATGRSSAIISAQRTRILNKCIKVPSHPEAKARVKEQSGQEVLENAQNAGQAKYDVEEEVVKKLQHMANPHSEVLDVHPMAMLGITIQFMKVCGGRLHAHQTIEDVYKAFKLLVDDGTYHDVPGVSTETKPWSSEQSQEKDMDSAVLEKMEEIKQMLAR